MEDLLDLGRLLAASLVDAVEALSVGAGKFVDVERGIRSELQLVPGLARHDGREDRILGLEMLVREARSSGPRA